RVYYHDEKQQGLTCCVTEAGSKTYYLYRWVQGRPERVRIAKVGELSVEQARDEAKRMIGEIATGKNPQVERIGKRGEPTVAESWQHWLTTAKLHNRRKNYLDHTTKAYELYVKPWANRRLSTLTADVITRWHSSIASKTFQHGRDDKRRRGGTGAANHALAVLGCVFTGGEALGYKGDNPIGAVKHFPQHSRERFLQADELAPFLRACEAEPEPWSDYWPMCLWTGARRGNVASMKWKDLDLDRGLWFLSGEDTKTGKPITIVLAPPAIEILRRRRAESRGGSPWVFSTNHPCGHVPPDVGHHWERLLNRAGLEGLVPHDLRRSLASWQALGGSSLQVIAKSLGHAKTSSTEVYARLLTDPVRVSVNGAVAAILAAAGKAERQEGDGGA
ncbi:MAG: site-specific integrase, partial [Candidatus Anammoximicrobium sp.]|nr:site-specific integrase [Candidatus Anammoximicrobium sp.]